MARLEIDDVKRDRFSRDVARVRVSKLCRAVEGGAKRRVGHKYGTGQLKTSIGTKISSRRWEVTGEVGSRVRHALVHEVGARPHRIPKHGFTPMTFYWRKVGKTVTLLKVNHPGSPAYKYLRVPLVENAPRLGFKVRVTFFSPFG